MKAKLLNVLAVCLVTLAVCSPGLVVLSVVWVRHIEFVKTQKLVFAGNNINPANITPSTTNENLSQSQLSSPFAEQNAVNQLLTAENYRLASILQWLILITPVLIGLGILVYDRYLIYRAAVLKQQIEMLEKLWQQSIEQ